MKMEKKKLKFKFLVVCLMFVLSFGFVSFTTFAYSSNAQVGDSVISMHFSNEDYSITDSTLFVEFSNGYCFGYNAGKEIYVISNSVENWQDSSYYVDELIDNDVFTFDEPVTIVNISNIDVGQFDLNFDIVEPTLLESIFDVFTNIGTYIMFLISSLIVVFYVEGQLTILGILALCGLGISIILLIFNIISRFLHFRG